ncbi:MAG: MFS transporter [Woeseiaceae bacterium]|nr:MFS transporter [Woeseiaceae bacterium]
MQYRNLIILILCQLISATGSFVMVTLGGIIGTSLAPNPAWATLPVSMMVIAVAATTVPATLLMRRIGRGKGFALASLSSIVALLVAIQALETWSFVLFIVAAMLFGINLAFTQQYRYAAAESVTVRYVPRAISFVLVGSIGGAFLGEFLIVRADAWRGGAPYSGVLTAVAVLYAVQFLLFLWLRSVTASQTDAIKPAPRPLRAIVRQPVYLVAVFGGTAGYGLMTLIMTATPISMHVHDGFEIEQMAAVIRAHVLGMYVPSLVSGFLIERFGVTRLMFIGALLLLVTSIVGLQGQTLLHYWWALVMLGVGWNFLYVGGTTMLTYTYSLEERFRAQAVNEFLVFGISATASLLAGTVLHYFGWFRLMLIPLPVLIAIALALIAIRRDPLLLRPATVT